MAGGAFHVINKASVDELRRRVYERHPESSTSDFSILTENFKPNLVIDVPEAFAEDRFFEMRAGSVLLRNNGPAIRCNVTRLNLDKREWNDEFEPM